MSLTKRFSIILVCVGVFFCALSFNFVTASADGDLVTVKDGVPALPDTVKPGLKTSQLTDQQRQAIIDKTLDWYFPNLKDYARTCAEATLSAALKLYESKKDGDINGLQYYLKSAALSMRSLAAASGTYSYNQWRSAGDSMLSINSYLAEQGIVNGVVDWDQFTSDTALTAVRRFIDPTSGEEKTEESAPTAEDVTVSSDVFKEYVESENLNNSPKGKGLFKQSYRTDTYIHSNYDSSRITLFNEPGLKEPFEDLYLYPFYMDENGEYYYTDSQIHLYYVPNDDPNSDIALQCDSYLYVDSLGFVLDSTYSKIIKEFTSATVPFVYSLNPLSNISSECLFIYNSEIDYSKNQPNSSTSLTFLKLGYYNSDRSVCFYPNFNSGEFSRKYSYNSERGFPYRDIGYICSHEMISRQYTDIDTSKIPDNYYVTISGDTIYDYSITNPETGDSDTINNYVTNNYTYITNNNCGDGSGGSGGSGGNVTVGGKIDVGGTVGVDINVSVPDININVNQGSGGAGGTSFGEVNTDPLDDYLNSALDESSGIRNVLNDFFGFLPPEILTLIGIGVTFVILGRIFGR